MFFFEKEQYIYNVGGVKVGGNLGETPTVLVGTIFYGGHKIVRDAAKGEIDKKTAEDMIITQIEMSDTTGNPAMVQVFSEYNSAMEKYLDFIAGLTDAPFLIDSTQPGVRIAGLRYTEEVGLVDRAVYNSINVAASEDEIEALRDIRHDCAIVLAFNPQDPSIAGRRAVLESGTAAFDQGLLSLCEDIGVTKPLIDTAITAMGAGAGSAASFTFVAKTIYGHPVGSGIHNAPSSWTWLRKYRKTNREAFKVCDIASNLLVQSMGANFLLYGPIENAGVVFPAVAMADIFSAESARLEIGLEPPESHPFKKLL
ncbi:MAG: tetrahydromethanopterin S-methyltransferase subunit H [Candidatus Thorarchaeota archaeon SMTZ1-83]|nr:MAG: tetrahydromethanopterin S-methyltransferase subunit H [Candidatus Thorarchaeota archaeon SMTZ1-83]